MRCQLTPIFTIISLTCILLIPLQTVGREHQALSLSELNELPLRKPDGAAQTLSDLSDDRLMVVVFLGTECPLAKLYLPRLAEISRQYADCACIVGVISNAQDTLDEIKTYVDQHEVDFLILKDSDAQLASALEAERTPEAFIIDASGKVLYRGRIDDQYGVGYARQEVRQEDLKRALDELRSGKVVSVPRTEAVGCFIGRMRAPRRGGSVTYRNKIFSILQKHCAECHQEGEIAPFALTEYDDVAAWSETIREVIEQGRMPPWHANPHHGSFSNTRRMSQEEKREIVQWIEEGCPRGESPLPKTTVKASSGWQLGKEPDQIIPMRETPFTVPAEGTVDYQYFVVDPKFTEDRWVTAAEVLPSNRSVVHHAIVFIAAPDQDALDNYGWLAAYVPGQRLSPLKKGQARKIPAGSRLVFQMHYTPKGSVEQDQTKIGLVFTEEPNVTEEIMTLITANRHFKIPPGADHHQVRSSLTEFPANAQLTAIVPHMHLRGKSFRIIYQDNTNHQQILLDVPQYDFNWQHVYRLKHPLPLNTAEQIQCVAHFDNSVNNVVNPDPLATVRWGDQSWEEMMVAFFEVAVPRSTYTRDVNQERQSKYTEAKQLATQWIKKRDRNGDDRVQPDEVSDVFRRFAFSEVDRNRDREINLEETTAHIRDSLVEKSRQRDIQKQLEQLK